MVSNNLIAGQVDTGSMAYVLSTSTKRSQVVFTQAMFMVSALFLMTLATSLVGSLCLLFVDLSRTALNFTTLHDPPLHEYRVLLIAIRYRGHQLPHLLLVR